MSQSQLEAPGMISQTTATSCGAEVFSHSRLPARLHQPVLVLLHGYPNTNYLWRKIIKLLPDDTPLFIPDLPGYGFSTPSRTTHDKRAIIISILEALKALLPSSSSPHSIILCGHDRGARLAHRFAVDLFNTSPTTLSPLSQQDFNLEGTICMDIVPETNQWESFATAKNAASTFHWPFLANAELATTMIAAYGAGKWCRDMITRWGGHVDQISTDNALDVYAAAFEREGVVAASCADYEAGAGIDVQRQEEDQNEGRKVKGKFMAIWSQGYLGQRYDVPKVWGEWLEDGGEGAGWVEVGNGAGHFLPEEASEVVAKAIKDFMGN